METILWIFAAVYLLQEIDKHVDQRRAAKKEAELLKQIRSLENRIHAKDIAGFLELEANDRLKAVPLKPKAEPQPTNGNVYDPRYAMPGYEDPDGV